jgi:hypothetical protein
MAQAELGKLVLRRRGCRCVAQYRERKAGFNRELQNQQVHA